MLHNNQCYLVSVHFDNSGKVVKIKQNIFVENTIKTLNIRRNIRDNLANTIRKNIESVLLGIL